MPDPDLDLARLLARRQARFARHLAEDLEAESLLAACEYRGPPGGLGAYLQGRLARFVRRNAPCRSGRQLRDPGAVAGVSGQEEGSAVLRPAAGGPARAVRLAPTWAVRRSRGRELTPGQKRRFRRNLVIAAAHRQGCSQRLLAEVFHLPRSRIGEILRELADQTGKARSCS